MRLIPAAAFVLVVAGAGAAFAWDGKVYPASMCQPQNATHAARAEYTANGRVCNTSPSDALVLHCPLVRDSMTTGIRYFRVSAKVADTHGMDCVLRTLEPVGDGYYSSQSIHFDFDGSPDWWQEWTSYLDMLQTVNGPYQLSCTLPPSVPWTTGQKQNCLGAYRVDEE